MQSCALQALLSVTAYVGHQHDVTFSNSSTCYFSCRILGEQNANLPRIMGVLAAVLARGTDLASEDTLRRMVTLLQHMRQGLPPQVLKTSCLRHVSSSAA